ncbi:MAG: Lrp/AsnC family transcriptional regulator [Acidobacteriota bacterium]
MRALDRTDHALLTALQKNARITNKELAVQVGLAPSTCLERVRRLERGGAITGYHAEVSPKALGIGIQALIAIRLTRHSRDRVDSFRRHALTLPEVIAIYHLAGANDFLVHVAVQDSNTLRDFALSAFTTRPEVAHLETNLIFEHQSSTTLPMLAKPMEWAG